VGRDDFDVMDPAPAVAFVVFDPHVREMHLVVVVRQAMLSRPPRDLLVVSAWSSALSGRSWLDTCRNSWYSRFSS
jgi:hypothetical protein